MDDTESLSVVFGANIDQIMAAGTMIDTVFAGVVSSAESSAGDITASMESAAESFSALSEGAAQISVGVEEGVAGAVEALDQLPSVGEEAGSSLSESVGQASTGFVELQDAVSALADSVNTAVGEINTQIDSIGTNADDAATQSQSAFSGMVTSVGMGIFSLQAMGQMATSTALDLLGPAASAQTVDSALTTLLGSTQAASKELSNLDSFAAKTPFKTLDIDSAAEQLIGFKTKAADVVPDITAIGDALGAVGRDTPVELNSVVDIFGKMNVTGKVSQATITQLGIHGIDALGAIARGADKSQAQIQSMIKNGTLPATDAIKDLTKGIEENPMLAGGMARSAATFTGLMSTLSSNWDQLLSSFGSPILEALSSHLNDAGNALAAPAFKDFAGTIGKGVITAFGQISTAVLNAGQFFDNPAFGKLATLLGGQLSTGVQALAGYFDSPAFGQFAKVVGVDVANALLTTTQDIENIVSWTIQWHEPILIVAGVLGALFIPAIIQSGVESVIAGGKIAVNFVGSIVKTGVEGYQAAGKVGLWVAGVVSSGTESVVAGAKIAGTWVAGVVASGTQSAIAGAKIAGTWVAGVIASGTESVIAGAKIAGSFVLSLVQAGAQAAVTAGAFLVDLVPAVVSVATESIVAAAVAIPGLVVGFGAWALSAGIAAAATIAATWPVLLVGAVIALVVGGIILAVTHWSQITTFIGGVVGNVMGDISGFFANVGGDIHDITGHINDAFTGVGTIISNVWNQAMGDVKNAINTIIDGIDGFIGFIDGIQIHIPSVKIGLVTTPAFDWNGLGLPKIPHLATGGTVAPGGFAIAGDPGPNSELVYGGTSGLSVFSHAQSSALMGGGGGSSGGGNVTHVHIHFDGQEMASFLVDPLMNRVVKMVRMQGGKMVSI